MNKDLIIIRGLPGAGKSLFATFISNNICTADDYFINDKGEYIFDPVLSIAHTKCFMKCENFLQKGIEKVVVANTSTTEWEFKGYIELGKKYGYRVHSIIIENRRFGQNTHNVPVETIEKMEKRFDIKLR